MTNLHTLLILALGASSLLSAIASGADVVTDAANEEDEYLGLSGPSSTHRHRLSSNHARVRTPRTTDASHQLRGIQHHTDHNEEERIAEQNEIGFEGGDRGLKSRGGTPWDNGKDKPGNGMKQYISILGVKELTGTIICKVILEKEHVKNGKSKAEAARLHKNAMDEVHSHKVIGNILQLDAHVLELEGEDENNGIGRIMSSLRSHGSIAYCEPNWVVYHTATPDDPMLNNQWHHDVMNSRDAWDISVGSSSVTISICDSGVDLNHPDLSENRAYPGYNAKDKLWGNEGGSVGITGKYPMRITV